MHRHITADLEGRRDEVPVVEGRDDWRDVLQFVTDAVASLCGFGLAALSVVDGDELVVGAVSGDQALASGLVGRRAPVERVLAELAPADRWDRLLFVPHDRVPGELGDFAWTSHLEAVGDPEAWHAGDLLCALLRDADGRLVGLLSVDLPLTGRRPGPGRRGALNAHVQRAESAVRHLVGRRELEHRLEEEQRASRRKELLMATLAHEVRSPTASVVMHAELALEKEPDGRARRHLEAIIRGGTRVSEMAESMLRSASIDVDAPLPELSVDLAAIAREVGSQVDGATARDVELDVPEDGATIVGDTEQIGAVVRNLLTNALKYSDPGDAVRMSVDVRDDDVVLAVSDEGIGISEEDQAHVFEEFYRASGSDVRTRPGHGLGLSIVDRIVRRHGGTVAVHSRAGDGTTMCVTLPRARRGCERQRL